MSPVGWMPLKILIRRSLGREGTKKASREAWEGDEAAPAALYARTLPPRPEGHTQNRYETVTIECHILPGESSDELSPFCRVEGSMFFVKLAHFVIRRRRWIVSRSGSLSLFVGFFTSSQIGKRWFESFSIPGYSAYEANQRTLKTFGSGEQAPLVARLPVEGRRHDSRRGSRRRSRRPRPSTPARARAPSSRPARTPTSRRTGTRPSPRSTAPASPGFSSNLHIKQVRAAIEGDAPPGVTGHLTGRDPLQEDIGGTGGPSILIEVLIGGIGALLVLLFVFGTLPAVACRCVTAAVSILTTFSAVWALTYVTDVSIIVEFLVALVGLGVAIDYSLLMIFRFREELHHGGDVEEALVETMTHAGPLGGRLRLDGRDRPAQHGLAAAAVHPLDRDRRDADPGSSPCSRR